MKRHAICLIFERLGLTFFEGYKGYGWHLINQRGESVVKKTIEEFEPLAIELLLAGYSFAAADREQARKLILDVIRLIE